jgi:hypothetical protein
VKPVQNSPQSIIEPAKKYKKSQTKTRSKEEELKESLIEELPC